MDKECVNSDRTAVLDAAFKRIREKAGNNHLLGKIVGRSRQGAKKWQWTGVPPGHVLALEDELGIPAYDINPLLYPKERILKWAKQIRAETHNARTPK